jgi:hypothetical protein
MKKIAITLTILATVAFTYSSYQLTYDPIVKSTKEGILIFNFMLWYALPALAWIVYFLRGNR